MAFFLLFGFDEKTLMAPQSLSNLFAVKLGNLLLSKALQNE
jgi:hypothetical protein